MESVVGPVAATPSVLKVFVHGMLIVVAPMRAGGIVFVLRMQENNESAGSKTMKGRGESA